MLAQRADPLTYNSPRLVPSGLPASNAQQSMPPALA